MKVQHGQLQGGGETAGAEATLAAGAPRRASTGTLVGSANGERISNPIDKAESFGEQRKGVSLADLFFDTHDSWSSPRTRVYR